MFSEYKPCKILLRSQNVHRQKTEDLTESVILGGQGTDMYIHELRM